MPINHKKTLSYSYLLNHNIRDQHHHNIIQFYLLLLFKMFLPQSLFQHVFLQSFLLLLVLRFAHHGITFVLLLMGGVQYQKVQLGVRVGIVLVIVTTIHTLYITVSAEVATFHVAHLILQSSTATIGGGAVSCNAGFHLPP